MPKLEALTSPEVVERSPSVLVIPLGATEQHGPHLPVATDTLIAEAVAGRVVAGIDGALLGPTISIGASGEHTGFAGTLSVGTEVLASMLVEVVRTAGPEFALVAVVNAHGGNVDAIEEARLVCESEGRRLAAWSTGLRGADAHAGRTETSLMLAIAPDLVHLDRAEPGETRPVIELVPRLREGGLRAVSANGVLGDPTGASSLAGESLLVQLVGDALRSLSIPPPGRDSGA